MSAVIAILARVYSHLYVSIVAQFAPRAHEPTARVVSATRLPRLGVEAVGNIGFSTGALLVIGTARLGASVSGFALLLVGLVAAGVATHQALSRECHDSQAVWLSGLDGDGTGGQKGDGSDGLEKHLGRY